MAFSRLLTRYHKPAILRTLWKMAHGHRLRRQKARYGGDGRSAENEVTHLRYRIDEEQDQISKKCTRCKINPKLEKFALRKNGGRRTINKTKRSVPADLQHRYN